MIETRYFLCCDYATVGANGKPIALHIFDNFFVESRDGALSLPPFSVLARVECSIADGPAHDFTLALLDEDGTALAELPLPQQQFGAQGPGLPLAAQLFITLHGLPVPACGTYTLALRTGGRAVGETDIRVLPLPVPGA